MADHQNWANLLQKLAPQNLSQDPKLPRNKLLESLFAQEANKKIVQPTSNSSEVEDANRGNLYENNASSTAVNYIEEVPELQIKNVRNINPEERTGRTIALNSRFICYSDENDTLFIKSLKNLSLIHIIQELNSKISDIAFLEDTLSNYLGLITVNGTLVVYSIDLNSPKDKIVVKEILTQNLERFSENIQLQWKDSKKIGVLAEKELTVFDIESEEKSESAEGQAGSQSSFQFEDTVTDFTFSPGYPLVYILLDTNTVQIINLNTGAKIREFTPHKDAVEPVMRILSYKSLIKHESIQGKLVEGNNVNDEFRDIFITVTKGFEIKVWDLSEWDAENEAYFCIETYQLNQNNSNFDPNSLIKRCIFYDPGLNFVFLGFKLSDERGINITALHIDELYHGYNDSYASLKKSKKFFNSTQALLIKKNSLTDLAVLNFSDDEMDYYFKKNSYLPMMDLEPASTRTQDGSYAFDSKSVLIFFIHNEDTISVSKVLGEKLYPFALVEELDKITQAEQFDSQSTTSKGEGVDSFPPEISGFIKEIINESKKLQEEEKNTREADFGKKGKKQESVSYSEEISESYKSNVKEETGSPDAPKAQQSHKKKHGNERKKDKEGQGKGQQKGDSQKGPNVVHAANLESALGIDRESSQTGKKDDNQMHTIERGIERRFQELTDKSIQLLNNKFSRIEEVIEKRVNERVAKLQMDNLNNAIAKQVEDKMQREFSNAFEKSVTPCFEKYLIKMFEQITSSFEKGQKFYIDKLHIEQAKGAQLKETMNEVIKSFVQISNSLNEGLMNNQASFNRTDLSIQDKQNQISILIEQVNEIMMKQQDIHGKIDNIKKEMHEMRMQHQAEVAVFGETANRYIQQSSQQGFDNKGQDKKDQGANPYNPYGAYPAGQFYNKGGKDKQHPLVEQLAYLEYLTKRPMDSSGGPMFRGAPMTMPGMNYPMTNSQIFGTSNPYQQQQQQQAAYGGYYDAYQKPRANSYAPGITNPPPQQQNLNQLPNVNPQIAPQITPQTPQSSNTQANPQMNQLSPELQSLYQQLGQFLNLNQVSKEKEEEKYLPSNVLSEDESKKFSTQGGQVKPQTSNQTPSSQRGSANMENQQYTKTSNSNTPNQTFIQQDQESLDKPNIQQQLPPGIQQTTPPQPNFVQALLENLPQNLQQNFTQVQAQGIPQAKTPDAFYGMQNNTQATNQANSGAMNINYLQTLFPSHVNPSQNQNYSNFGGYQFPPPQMTNPTINKAGGIKNPSTVDFSQIPLVNSMFKTPSRDTTTDEDANTSTK